MVEDFYNRDFTDCFVDDRTEMSQDELRFMQNAKKIQFKEIPLPFKDHVVSVPKNKLQALSRITWLKKRFENDPRLHNDYSTFMKEFEDKGYHVKCLSIRRMTKASTRGTYLIMVFTIPINREKKLQSFLTARCSSEEFPLTACYTRVQI